MTKLLATLATIAALLVPSSSLASTFLQGEPIKTVEFWYGSVGVPADATDSTDDYVLTTAIKTYNLSAITYNGWTASNAAGRHNHWVLTPGTYIVTASAVAANDTSTACNFEIYGDTSAGTLIASAQSNVNGRQSSSVFLTVTDATFPMYPWSSMSGSVTAASCQWRVLIERVSGL